MNHGLIHADRPCTSPGCGDRWTVQTCSGGVPKYVRISLFAKQTGYTEKAIRRKIEEGIWVQNREYRRAPDGSVLIDVEGYYKWVEGSRAAA